MDTTTLSALAEPNRMHIVELLRERPRTVGEIAERLHIRQPQASKHLKVLLEAGIVDVAVDANRRIYSLRLEPFKQIDNWLDAYRQLWEDRFYRLEDYLKVLQDQVRDQDSNPNEG